MPWKKTLIAVAIAGVSFSSRAVEPESATTESATPREDESAVQLETVTVSGKAAAEGFKAEEQESGKMPMTLRETPQSISVITRESLDDRQVFNLQQALELSAGVTQYSGNGPFAGQPSFGFNQTTIRGIDIDSIYDFREDGFVNGSFYSVTDLAIYDRIEVVKGPNSVLYGRGSPGGLINRVRKKPLAQTRTDLELGAGSFDTYRADIDVTGPLLASRKVRGRLIASYEDSDSFVRGPETERTVLAPSLDFDLSPSTHLLLQGLYQSEDIIPNTGMPLRANGENFEAAPRLNRRDYQGIVTRDPYAWKIESATAQLEQDLSDDWLATLRLNTSNIDTPIRVDAYAYGLLDEDGNTSVLGNDFRIDRDVWSGELQFVGSIDVLERETKLGFGVDISENQYSRRGAYTEYLDANLYDRDIPLPDRDTLSPGSATEGKPRSRGAYAQAQVRASERLTVLLGLRYDQVDYNTTPFYRLDSDGDGVVDDGNKPPRQTHSNLHSS